MPNACTSCSGRSRRSSTANGVGRRFPLPKVEKALPTATAAVSPVLDHFCWTHFLGEVNWCSTGCTQRRRSVIAFAPFQIQHFKRIFKLLTIEFSLCVSNKICDDRCQEKCSTTSTLVIALFRTSGFTVILIRKFRPWR